MSTPTGLAEPYQGPDRDSAADLIRVGRPVALGLGHRPPSHGVYPVPRVNGGALVAPAPVMVRYMASWAPALRRADGNCSRRRRDRLKGHAEAGP
jgi:hypothetical protein